MSERPLHPGERPPPARHFVEYGTEFKFFPDGTWQRLEGHKNTTPGPQTPWELAERASKNERKFPRQQKQGESSSSFTPAPPPKLTRSEKAWLDRVATNEERPEPNVHAPAPVWAERRAELTSTLEYFEAPKQIVGGSVHISGGAARCIMLEGDAGDGYVFWGTGRTVGTIVVPFGAPRVVGAANTKEIKACLMAHRARLPVVVGVSQDYSGVIFRVAKPYMMLGMFWITDAWLEPIGVWPSDGDEGGRKLRWRFRLDWCDEQGHPWWEAPVAGMLYQYPKRLKPSFETSAPWSVKEGGKLPSESVRKEPRLEADPTWVKCDVCDAHSIEMYVGIAMCLNEHCERFFKAPGETETSGLRSRRIMIRPIRNVSRVLPSTLKIQVRPPPEEGKIIGKAPPEKAYVNYWRGWCCDKCGRASERWDMEDWSCPALDCGKRFSLDQPRYGYQDLLPPTRIISTGPRVDEGTPQRFPKDTVVVVDVWTDGLKVCKRVIPDQVEIFHGLAHADLVDTKFCDVLFKELQAKGSYIQRVPQDRRIIKTQDTLWPIYTLFLDFAHEELAFMAKSIDGLPPRPLHIQKGFENLHDNILAVSNNIGERLTPGELGFMSKIVTHTMPKGPPMMLSLGANDRLALLFLGCDCEIFFHLSSTASKDRTVSPTLKAQHGDMIILQTLRSPLRISINPLGLSFVVLSPGVNKSEVPEYLGPENEKREIEHVVERVPTKRKQQAPREWAGQGNESSASAAGEASSQPTKSPFDIQGWKIGPYPIVAPEPVDVDIDIDDDAAEPHSAVVV